MSRGPGVVVWGDQLHTGQSSSYEAAPKARPCGPVLARSDAQPEYFSMSRVFHTHRQQQRPIHPTLTPAPFAALDHQRIGPHICVGAGIEWPVRELGNGLVQFPG